MRMFLLSLIATSIHAALMFATAPLAAGVNATCRARLTGHVGPGSLQPYFNLARLLQKATLIPDTATELYPVWPYLDFAASAAAALLVPSFCTGMLTASASDFISFAGLLTLARAASWASGLETGSSAGGAAISRDLTFTICAAAAWAVAVLTLILSVHGAAIDGAVAAMRQTRASLALPAALVAALAPALANPGGAGARLQYSGRLLLLFEYGAMLRLITLLALLGALVCPWGLGLALSVLSWPAGLLLWAIKLLLLCAALALVQTAFPRPGPVRMPQVMAGAALLGLISAIFLFITVQSDR